MTCPTCHDTRKVMLDFGVLQSYPCPACRADWWEKNPAPWMRPMSHSQVTPGGEVIGDSNSSDGIGQL